VIPDKLKITLDYNFAYGDIAYALGDSVVLLGTPINSQITQNADALQQLPDVKSMLNVLTVRGEYTLRQNVTLIFGYSFERLTYKDYLNNAGTTQYANALLPGSLKPTDSIHVVGASMRIRF
jgi:hypothetical protein